MPDKAAPGGVGRAYEKDGGCIGCRVGGAAGEIELMSAQAGYAAVYLGVSILEREKELIDILNRKREALDFWTGVRQVMPLENKIALLNREIHAAKSELEELRKQRLEALKQ